RGAVTAAAAMPFFRLPTIRRRPARSPRGPRRMAGDVAAQHRSEDLLEAGGPRSRLARPRDQLDQRDYGLPQYGVAGGQGAETQVRRRRQRGRVAQCPRERGQLSLGVRPFAHSGGLGAYVLEISVLARELVGGAVPLRRNALQQADDRSQLCLGPGGIQPWQQLGQQVGGEAADKLRRVRPHPSQPPAMPTISSTASPSASGVSSSTCWPLTIAMIVSKSGPWKPSASATAPGVSPGEKSSESRSCFEAARFARIGISLTSTMVGELLGRSGRSQRLRGGRTPGALPTRMVLAADELRLAALKERAHALAVVLRREHPLQRLRVVGNMREGVARQPLVEQPLDLFDRQWGAARELLRQRLGAAA